MSDSQDRQPPQGPPDVVPWAERLRAHVVERRDDASPRVHGYDVQRDLARHYSFAEVAALALCGTPPQAEQGRALEVALTFLSAVSVAEAPAHAAVLAALCGARPAALVATAASGLAERAAARIERCEPLWQWLDGDASQGPAPEPCRARSDLERAAVARLVAALPQDWPRPLCELDLGLEPALLLVLHDCGVRGQAALTAAVTLAGLSCVVAEASAVTPGAFIDYPTTRAPAFDYVAPPRDDTQETP